MLTCTRSRSLVILKTKLPVSMVSIFLHEGDMTLDIIFPAFRSWGLYFTASCHVVCLETDGG
jgi:hypothetical protein